MQDPDITVYSDGSGYQPDGYGAWAALAVSRGEVFRLFRTGMSSGTSVDRMEMTAMLEGLQMADEIIEDEFLNKEEWHYAEGLGCDRPRFRVRLLSDRESMVLSIKGVYGRTNAPDLWERFSYYEKRMEISAEHVARETDFADFQWVDLFASTGRIVIKQYLECFDLPGKFSLNTKTK
jgi:hypothetical protein